MMRCVQSSIPIPSALAAELASHVVKLILIEPKVAPGCGGLSGSAHWDQWDPPRNTLQISQAESIYRGTPNRGLVGA